ncbi:MAG TPA: nickel pincer cofactor biosynthesis protein LarC [Dehalococcoidia bacterium]|nr:nickel pincer cofactor biosynthesis protein LarC [Dehalococcoidia bacterium]|tara:strand:- start:243 stop:1406 length:1164 start_codon:yes stop_codon:yes gene_type:complete
MIGGVSGDMLLGAMVDVGLDLDELQSELNKFSDRGYRLEKKLVNRGGLEATLVAVVLDIEGERKRTWGEFYSSISQSSLDDADKRSIKKVFDALADAEASAHGGEAGSTHLHELGTVDTLVDIASAVIGLRLLGVEKLHASAFPVGIGISSSSHGAMGATSIATAAIYRASGAPVRAGGKQPVGEAVTPTGAAIVSTLAMFDPIEFSADHIGYGAGQRDPDGHANVVGFWIGEGRRRPELMLLETNIDDSSGEVLGYVHEQLFELGCLDVWFTPIQMKKNRPATMLSVLVGRDIVDAAAEMILKETSTLGVRRRAVYRYEAERQIINVDTSLGKLPVKLKRIGDTIAQAAPEYDACRDIARETGLPIAEVIRVVVNEATMRGSPWGE